MEVLSLQGEELQLRLASGTMGYELYDLVRERMPCKAGAKVPVSDDFLSKFGGLFQNVSRDLVAC